jgi:hypothetical protein
VAPLAVARLTDGSQVGLVADGNDLRVADRTPHKDFQQRRSIG